MDSDIFGIVSTAIRGMKLLKNANLRIAASDVADSHFSDFKNFCDNFPEISRPHKSVAGLFVSVSRELGMLESELLRRMIKRNNCLYIEIEIDLPDFFSFH